jgi:hypothetical protein
MSLLVHTNNVLVHRNIMLQKLSYKMWVHRHVAKLFGQ